MAWIDKISGHQRIRTISALLAVLLALPFGWKGVTGFYEWLSPFLMLNSFLVLKSFVWLNSIALIVLVFAVIRERWFCCYVCPVGWGCDLVSSFYGLPILPSVHLIFPWIWCSRLCALGGLQDEITAMKRSPLRKIYPEETGTFNGEKVVFVSLGGTFQTGPVVHMESCVGCRVCAVICPP